MRNFDPTQLTRQQMTQAWDYIQRAWCKQDIQDELEYRRLKVSRQTLDAITRDYLNFRKATLFDQQPNLVNTAIQENQRRIRQDQQE